MILYSIYDEITSNVQLMYMFLLELHRRCVWLATCFCLWWRCSGKGEMPACGERNLYMNSFSLLFLTGGQGLPRCFFEQFSWLLFEFFRGDQRAITNALVLKGITLLSPKILSYPDTKNLGTSNCHLFQYWF